MIQLSGFVFCSLHARKLMLKTLNNCFIKRTEKSTKVLPILHAMSSLVTVFNDTFFYPTSYVCTKKICCHDELNVEKRSRDAKYLNGSNKNSGSSCRRTSLEETRKILRKCDLWVSWKSQRGYSQGCKEEIHHAQVVLYREDI